MGLPPLSHEVNGFWPTIVEVDSILQFFNENVILQQSFLLAIKVQVKGAISHLTCLF